MTGGGDKVKSFGVGTEVEGDGKRWGRSAFWNGVMMELEIGSGGNRGRVQTFRHEAEGPNKGEGVEGKGSGKFIWEKENH